MNLIYFYQSRVAQAVKEYGGFVSRYIGDGVVASHDAGTTWAIDNAGIAGQSVSWITPAPGDGKVVYAFGGPGPALAAQQAMRALAIPEPSTVADYVEP